LFVNLVKFLSGLKVTQMLNLMDNAFSTSDFQH